VLRRIFGEKRDKVKGGWRTRSFITCIDWIGLAQNRSKLRAVVNAVMNLQIP
jgi:hypothetical protein